MVDIYEDYWLLTVPALRLEVNQRGLTAPSLRKADLVRTLVIADANNVMANPIPGVQWQHLSDQCILDAIDRLQLVFPAPSSVYADNRQGRVQFLGDIGIQPWQCLPLPATPAVPVPPAGPHQPPTPKLPDLNKQAKDETARAFFGRLDGFLSITNTATNAARLQCLYGAANSVVSNFVSTQVQAGTTDYETIKQRAIERFEPSFLMHMQLYQSARKQSKETFCDFGYRLRMHYLGYLQLTEGEITPDQETHICKAMVSQVLGTLSAQAQKHMSAQLLQQPNMNWHQFLTQLEAFAASRRQSSDTEAQGANLPWSQRRPHHNGTHGGQPARGQSQCFVCGHTGHLSTTCPRRKGPNNQEN